MKRYFPIAAGCFLALPIALNAQAAQVAQNHAQEPQPVTWGARTANRSCVIFAERVKTSRRFYGIGSSTRTFGELTLLEAQGYNFPHKQLIETQENMDELMRMAHNDSVKFVKIPAPPSPEMLDKARASCKEAVLSQ